MSHKPVFDGQSLERGMPVPAQRTAVVKSEDILKGCPFVIIEHEGQRYQLRRTRENKLILTK